MISKTKYKIENKEIEKIFRAAGIGGITGISPLGAGEYNAVFSVSTREKEYVLKITPARRRKSPTPGRLHRSKVS